MSLSRAHHAHRAPADVRDLAIKVPKITLLFWVVKLLTTGMGETTWDWIRGLMGERPALILSGVALVASLVVQFRVRRYNAWVYWTAVVMVAVFGTAAADAVHNDFGVPYTVSTAVLLAAVAAAFGLWYAVEKTLDVHSIRTPRREAFYWTAVLLTFALGTAAGDWSAATLQLGYLPSGLIFLAAFVVTALAYRFLGLASVAAFWICYVITRPLGASFADWLAGPANRGGLELGMGPISGILTIVIVALVGYLAVSGHDKATVPTTDRLIVGSR